MDVANLDGACCSAGAEDVAIVDLDEDAVNGDATVVVEEAVVDMADVEPPRWTGAVVGPEDRRTGLFARSPGRVSVNLDGNM